MSAAVGTVGKAVGERISGGRPGPLRAFAAAAVVGAAAAVVAYKALRH
ncbi:MAG: hypothetical protein QOF83_3539 [Solirubrobacteraceae bacterium]|jgi:hypothetical protein|nr:hypothetical protein [Solirubrobacteraceae bacterium]